MAEMEREAEVAICHKLATSQIMVYERLITLPLAVVIQ
jgi:hypothetical protein